MTSRRLARNTTLLTAVLATMAGALVTLGLTAAPAQADYNEAARYGYVKVIEPEAYLRSYVHSGSQILHVDTEHMDAGGFWFAQRSGISTRGFVWQYQPFGMWCGGSTQTVAWNPWMNTHTCAYDYAQAEAEYPGITARTATCRSNTGHPWKSGNIFDNDECSDSALTSARMPQENGVGYTCAPWEEQGLTPSGASKCLSQRYVWESATPNSFWTPAPDACTGMPADANRRYANPSQYVPAGPVPDCTGEALATNCPPGDTHQACTGVPQVVNIATETATVTITNGTGAASSTKSATHTAIVYSVSRRVKKRYRGKTYKATRNVTLRRTATKTATANIALSNGTATSTITGSCSAGTMMSAQTCAASKAHTTAATEALAAANAEAASRAKASAPQAALTQAVAAARAAVAAAPVTSAEKDAAIKKAKTLARKAVNKQIAKAKRAR